MTDYNKSTNFASKDSLASGNALKIVKGTEIDTEFNNIATAVASKANTSSPTFTGTVVIPTATITAGSITGITDLAVADGGTGASDAATARTNLGLVIGTNVQAWDADLDTYAGKTAPSGTIVGTTDTQTLTNKTLTSPTLTTPNIDSAQVATVSGTAPIYMCRAWVNFNGTGSIGVNQTIRASGNVSSVYKNATGDYTINFTTSIVDANYSVSGNAMKNQDVGGNATLMCIYPATNYSSAFSTSFCRVRTQDYAGGVQDPIAVTVAIFR